MYSASISATSTRSKSSKSLRSVRNHMFTVPSWWQRAKFGGRLRSKQEASADGPQSKQELSQKQPSTQTRANSHALVKHGSNRKDSTQYWQHIKSSRSAGDLPTVNAMFKPLPRPPDSILRPARQSSYFNLSPNVSTFGDAVDTNFLSSLEQQVLQSVQLLSEPPMTEANVLVQLGVDAFWMSSRDAGMLERIHNLTEHLTPSAKATLLKDLNLLLKAPYKYPLQQVLRHGVQIVEKRQLTNGGDIASLIDMYSDIDMSTQHLLPAPLRVRKEGQGNIGFGTQRSVEDLPSTPRAEDVNEPQVAQKEGLKANLNIKQPGSVSRARAGMDSTQHETMSRNASSGNLVARPVERFYANKHSVEETEVKQPGSVRNARNRIYEKPRPAPKPPVSIARPIRQAEAKPTAPDVAPGSVARARIAAENAQSLETTTKAEDAPSASADRPKQLGSVARARIAAQNALLVDSSKTSIASTSDVRQTNIVPVSSLSTLKQGSAENAAREKAVSQEGVEVGLPERFSSLPLLTIEERRQNFKAGLSPVSGHHESVSTGAISEARNRGALAAITTSRTQYRNKDPYGLDFVSDSEIDVSHPGAPDLLTGSPLYSPAYFAFQRKEYDLDSRERPPVPAKDTFDSHGDKAALKARDLEALNHSGLDFTSPLEPASESAISTKPIFDIHKAVETFDRFRLRGGATSSTSQNSGEASTSGNAIKRRVSTLLGKRTILDDDERPPKALWWLAGGRTGGLRKVPTACELRERRKVEEANQEIVGFIGTAFGVRAVRRLPISHAEAEDEEGDDSAKPIRGENNSTEKKADKE